jgi:hypothetical protein
LATFDCAESSVERAHHPGRQAGAAAVRAFLFGPAFNNKLLKQADWFDIPHVALSK